MHYAKCKKPDSKATYYWLYLYGNLEKIVWTFWKKQNSRDKKLISGFQLGVGVGVGIDYRGVMGIWGLIKLFYVFIVVVVVTQLV